jgi:hypothetical protein
MPTLTRMLLAMAAVAALAALSTGPGQAAPAEEYDLSKIATMNVGDRLLVKDLMEVTRTATDSAGKPTLEETERQTAEITYEVLAVDDAGHPTEFRCTVTDAVLEQQVRLPKDASRKVVLADIVGTLKKAGAVFAADTTTLASGRMKSLTAPEVALVKRYFDTAVSPPIIVKEDTYVFPEKPVAAGTVWTPDNAAIDKMLQADSSAARIKARAKSGRFRLTAVKDSVADISGAIEFSLNAAGTPADQKTSLQGKLDIRTGIWQTRECRYTRVSKTDRGEVKELIKWVQEVEYKPGTGKASPLPEGLNKLELATPPR